MAGGPGLMAVGAGMQMYGSFAGGQASKEAYQDQAQSAEQNAAMALLKAKADAELQVIQSRKVLGEQTADFAAAGVTGGSALAVMADSKINAEMDRLSILFDGDIRNANFRSQAKSLRKQAKAASQAGTFGALGDGFMGAGQSSKK